MQQKVASNQNLPTLKLVIIILPRYERNETGNRPNQTQQDYFQYYFTHGNYDLITTGN